MQLGFRRFVILLFKQSAAQMQVRDTGKAVQFNRAAQLDGRFLVFLTLQQNNTEVQVWSKALRGQRYGGPKTAGGLVQFVETQILQSQLVMRQRKIRKTGGDRLQLLDGFTGIT